MDNIDTYIIDKIFDIDYYNNFAVIISNIIIKAFHIENKEIILK